jgi:hypothetical protein
MMRGDGANMRCVHHPDELFDHLLGDEVDDYAVFHRADGFNVARHLAKHLLGKVPTA